MADPPVQSTRTILIVGASRGLGLALATEFLARDWTVIGTVRAGRHTGLHDLARGHGGGLEIETLDIDVPEQIAALRERLSGRVLDILFVNAGTTATDANGSSGSVASPRRNSPA
jgi:NAD(P)-dependent dehydrogenase (short-subunit alcohol dehydrogenase family)